MKAQASGLEMVVEGNGVSPLRVVLALIPLAVAVLLAAAVQGRGAAEGLARDRPGPARLRTYLSIYQAGRSLGLWPVIAAPVVALVAPLLAKSKTSGT